MSTRNAAPWMLALLVVLAGCGSSKSSSVAVRGTLGWSGGVAVSGAPAYHVMPGMVTLKGASETRVVTADDHGRFSIRVPRGTYVVTGASPYFIVNGIRATCTAVGGIVNASRDQSGVLVLCEGT